MITIIEMSKKNDVGILFICDQYRYSMYDIVKQKKTELCPLNTYAYI